MATVGEKAERHGSLDATEAKADHIPVVSTMDGFESRATAARAANDEEHETTIRAGLEIHRKAVTWSLVISMSIIMEGYDTNLIGNFFAYPAFKEQFGVEIEPGVFQLQGQWQSALNSVATAGCIIGAFLNGFLIDRFGFRSTFLVSMAFMIAFIFLSFLGKTVLIQTVGQALCGIPWGVFATIGPAYASEVLPLALRPYLTAYTNICFCIGQLFSSAVLKGLVGHADQWSYRIPFAIQWLWPAPLMLAAWFMPESPWWLTRNAKYEEAERTVLRISNVSQEQAKNKIAMMVRTNQIEQDMVEGSSYLDCFRGPNARRTEIACMVFAGQVLSGSSFAYSATYFFEQAGMTSEMASNLGLVGTGIAFCGTVFSWFLMNKFGRRKLYIAGMMAMITALCVIGVLQVPNHDKIPSLRWVQSALCICWLLSFSLTVGPVGWTIPAEVSSTRLRSQNICLARNAYYIAQLIANVIQPYFMNPTELNWKRFTGFFWMGTASLTLLWAFFRLAETKGRTFEELDVMFGDRVPTRKFGSYVVDAYHDVTIQEQKAVDVQAMHDTDKV
ncbi:MFS transporter [Emericellopsis atlantica]|uniref:MFS transporter n=1 Tax=Emericellopsis atlantica TaxID=2614577 RepID=A0A9P7ZTW0_9HYPO|nr:MFS transporter [Emericellopsis atlantica]KAG9258011.1 MFS transporter [Emericellopsis atlantica]